MSASPEVENIGYTAKGRSYLLGQLSVHFHLRREQWQHLSWANWLPFGGLLRGLEPFRVSETRRLKNAAALSTHLEIPGPPPASRARKEREGGLLSPLLLGGAAEALEDPVLEPTSPEGNRIEWCGN